MNNTPTFDEAGLRGQLVAALFCGGNITHEQFVRCQGA